jgi:hypothetical protein
MKTEETFIRCEYCNEFISLKSPPSDDRYDNAEIHIGDGTILLPNKIVKKNHKRGISDSHAKDISGYYCSPECLKKKIKEILKP